MPEIITKYPEIVLKILKDAGIKCGEGAAQKILKACPAERFCSLPTGEICIYGTDEIARTTQLAQIAQTSVIGISTNKLILFLLLAFFAGLLAGLLLKMLLSKKKSKKRVPSHTKVHGL